MRECRHSQERPYNDCVACLQRRNRELEEEIKGVVTQPLDDICWRDVYTRLAKLVGIEFDPDMLPKSQMMKQCERFIDSLKGGEPYETDDSTRLIHRHESTIAGLLQVLEQIWPEYHRLMANTGEDWQTCISHQLCLNARVARLTRAGKGWVSPVLVEELARQFDAMALTREDQSRTFKGAELPLAAAAERDSAGLLRQAARMARALMK